MATCPICNNSGNLMVSKNELYTECLNCNTVFQHAEIKPIVDYYSDIVVNQKNQIGSYLSYLKQLQSIFEKGYCVIDIGCGDGTFLELLMERGYFDCFGIEQSETAKKVLGKKGINCISLDDLPSNKRKIITMFQVIEHISSPFNFIQTIDNKMQSGDYFVITTPCTDSKYRYLHGSDWRSYSPSYHLILYSRESINLLFKQFDYQLIYFNRVIAAVNSVAHSKRIYVKQYIKYLIKKCLMFNKPHKPLYTIHNSMLVVFKKI